MKTWAEVEQSESYKALTPAQKKAARRKYPFVQSNIQKVLKEIDQANKDMAQRMMDAVDQVSKVLAETGEAKTLSVAENLETSITNAMNTVASRVDEVEKALIQSMKWLQESKEPVELEPLRKQIEEIEFKQPNLAPIEHFMTEAGQTIEVINKKVRQIKQPEVKEWEAEVVERDRNNRIKTARIVPIS